MHPFIINCCETLSIVSDLQHYDKQLALICISRRLISIIYGMLKNGTEYCMPVVENAGEKL